MHNLERNKQELWFANRSSDSYVTDNNGLKTGEKRQTYGTPAKAMMNVSIAQGNVSLNPYGLTMDYTHTAITEDLSCLMDEQSVVWFGIEPTHEETQTVNGQQVTVSVPNPHNFVVIHKGKSLNHLVFYLKEVDVS